MFQQSRFFLGFVTITAVFFGRPTFGADLCPVLQDGTPVGLQCLHCMHSNAKGHAAQYTRALLLSCKKNLSIAYVMDGAFGSNLNVINEQVNAIISKGRNLNLHLYLLNGPAQRRWFKKTFKGFGNNIPPEVMRKKLESDKSFRRKYQNLVKRILPVMENAINQGASVSIVPMLEDNLTNKAFAALLALTKEVIPAGFLVRYARNPCSDCYPGNQFSIPTGILKEDHTFDEDFIQKGGFVSNDGTSYVYFTPSEKIEIPNPVRRGSRFEESVSLEELLPKLKQAQRNGTTFLLWLSKFQSTKPGSSSDLISRRDFPVPTEKEVIQIAEFLSTD